MNFWQIANAILGLMVAAITVYKLYCWPDNFNMPERAGLGMIGASMLLTIAPILSPQQETPFTDWSTTLLRLGVGTYFLGRARRFRQHARNGEAQKDIARAHFAAKVER